jgi:riboflavin kinase/FMN adenylyltransferase
MPAIMRIYESIKAFQKPSKAIVVMGIFDGVHLGHQQLLQQLRNNAQEVGGEVVMVTFWPHPRLVLAQPHSAPIQLLTTFNEKAAMLAQLGIDHLLKIRFTTTFSQLSARDFVQQVLVARVGMTQLVVGHDHRFGKDRAGNVTLLQEAGLHHGFTVTEVLPVMVGNITVSSTKIRQLLLAGAVEEAHAYLGRPYELHCSTLQEDRSGGKNFNIHLAATCSRKLIPADGLYIIQVVHQNIVEEGMLRIARKYDTPTMKLTVSSASSVTLPIPNLCIQFNKNLHLT